MSMATTNNETHTDSSTSTHTKTETTAKHVRQSQNWLAKFEELLKVKNLEELKTELGKLAAEIQNEIQQFDINEHLSPEAKSRLKGLEKNYADVMRAIHKAQKQFDREFSKSMRVLKRTRQDAETHIRNIKSKITKHRGTLVKASSKLKKKIKKTTSKKAKTKKASGAKKKSSTKS